MVEPNTGRGERQTVDSFGFRIPCRKFSFSINVTRDRRLPVVDEFVLRMLKLFDRLPVQRIRQFFGFTDREAEIVLRELVERNHIVIEGDFARLLPAADELFAASPDGLPRIISTEPWRESIWFELLAKSILPADRVSAFRHLIEVKPNRREISIPTDYARDAFSENFYEYVRNIKRVNDPDSVHLYSISHVEPGEYGCAVYRSSDELTLVDGPRIETEYGRVVTEKFTKLRPLVEAMAAARRDLTVNSIEPGAHSFLDGIAGNSLLSDSIGESGAFDIPQWLERMASLPMSAALKPIIGATYIPRNIETLVALVEAKPFPKTAIKVPEQIVWSRPRGTAWGVTPDINSAVQRVRLAWRNVTREEGAVHVNLLDMHRASNDTLRTFRPIFDRCVSVWSRSALRSLDVLMIGRFGGAFTAPLDLGNRTSVPVGYACTDQETLARLERTIGLEDKLRTGFTLWSPNP
jgi:hypothetical protein